jgi:hypothetical protein
VSVEQGRRRADRKGVQSADFPWRPLGTLLVERSLLTAADLELALARQRRSGRLLGQILVDEGYLSSFTLTRVLAEQHGVELRRAPAAPADPTPQVAEAAPAGTWRPLGTVLVAKRVVGQAELEQALAEQRESPGRRLGEILVAHGWLTGAALAVALAEQHGLDIGTEDELEAELLTVSAPAQAEPVYQVCEVAYAAASETRSIVHESPNFLEAADFACEFAADRRPAALEIERIHGRTRETVWTYSESRAEAESAGRKSALETFGFDPTRWNAGPSR